MLKVYGLSEKNPLVWKNSYTKEELARLFERKKEDKATYQKPTEKELKREEARKIEESKKEEQI